MHLASRGLAANTINQQLAALRRLAHEGADSGLLSPELAAGISRVKGVKQLGFRSGNWLSAEESAKVLKRACVASMRAKSAATFRSERKCLCGRRPVMVSGDLRCRDGSRDPWRA
jgi:hypothetical protein